MGDYVHQVRIGGLASDGPAPGAGPSTSTESLPTRLGGRARRLPAHNRVRRPDGVVAVWHWWIASPGWGGDDLLPRHRAMGG
jgi:hypothetical protein